MKLPDDNKFDAYRASGAWGRVSLDMLVHKTAQSRGGQLAVADAADRSDWTGGTPRRLTYGELDDAVEATAEALRDLSLETGAVIGMLPTNTVDSVIAFLGAVRAGLIVAPVPPTWRAAEIVPAFDVVSTKAIITADRLEDAPFSEIARDAAIDIFGVRFVLGIGDDLADGVAPLSQITVSAAQRTPGQRDGVADHVATVTWAMSKTGDIVPVQRSHNQWIATGLMHLLEGRIEQSASIHSAFSLTGMVGIGTVLVPWLLAGGTLHLHHFRSLAGLSNDVAACDPDHVVLPAPLADPLAERLSETGTAVPTISAVWRSGYPGAAADIAARRADIDLLILDEFAVSASWRGSADRPAALPLGEIRAPRAAAGAPVLLETRLVGRPTRAHDAGNGLLAGEVSVAGAMVPSAHWPGGRAQPIAADDAGFVRTGLIAEPLDVEPPSCRVVGRDGTALAVGGTVIHLGAVDALLSEMSPNGLGAAYGIEDPVIGARLGAAVVAEAGAVVESDILDFVAGKKVALHKVPVRGTVVDALPVGIDGAVDRPALRRKTAAMGGND